MADTHETGQPDGSEPLSWLIAHGPISAEDATHLGVVLGRFGLTATFFSSAEMRQQMSSGVVAETDDPQLANFSVAQLLVRAQLEQIYEHGYRFSDLTLPSDIVVREHFRSFEAEHPGTDKRALTFAFHSLVNGGGEGIRANSYNLARQLRNQPKIKDRQAAQQEPIQLVPLPGVELVRRSDVGFPPYRNKGALSGPHAEYMSEFGIVASSIILATGILPAKRVSLIVTNTLSTLSDTLATQLAHQS